MGNQVNRVERELQNYKIVVDFYTHILFEQFFDENNNLYYEFLAFGRFSHIVEYKNQSRFVIGYTIGGLDKILGKTLVPNPKLNYKSELMYQTEWILLAELYVNSQIPQDNLFIV